MSVLDHEEADGKRAMMESAVTITAPTTGDKLGTVAPFVVGSLAALTYRVTKTGISEAVLTPYRATEQD